MMTATTAIRDEVDNLRTIYWFHRLRLATRAPSTYALERRVEPESFGRNSENDPYHKNKWSKYRRGLHTPNTAMTERAERIAPGSKRELNHVLWSVLRREGPIIGNVHVWMRALAPELQILLFERYDYLRIHADGRFLEKLERRASLDALACLTILLRINIEYGERKRVWAIAQSTFRVLLIMGHQLEKYSIADRLFAIYVERIFSLVQLDGLCFHFREYNFCQAANILYHVAKNTADTKGRWLTWHEHVRVMRRILRGDFGFDLKFALDPPTGPDLNLGPPTEKALEQYLQCIRLKNWGLENFLRGGKERFPPAEIF